MYEKVLKNAAVYVDGQLVSTELAIDSQKIAAIGNNLAGKESIDLKGCWVLPGAIDAHTHFSLPFAQSISADDFFSGSLAGAAGGVTSFIDFTAQQGNEGVIDSLERRINQAKDLAAIDYSFHACIGKYSEAVAEQLPQLYEHGINSLKIFMAYGKTGLMQDDAGLLKILTACQKHKITVLVHAENGVIIDDLSAEAIKNGQTGIEQLSVTRPVHTEVEAIRRLAYFSRLTGCNVYVVHVSSSEGALEIAKARVEGAPITGETCPQYLYLDSNLLNGPKGHYYSCCPPIRCAASKERLWSHVSKVLPVIATDHCPFIKKDKDTWNGSIFNLPMGLPGIETLPSLVLNGHLQGKISLKAAVDVITCNPAKIYGMYPQKGTLLPGTDADIMVFDPEKETIISSDMLNMAVDYSPYEGLNCKGWNIMTFLRGEIIYSAKSGWKGKKGGGVMIKRTAPYQGLFSSSDLS